MKPLPPLAYRRSTGAPLLAFCFALVLAVLWAPGARAWPSTTVLLTGVYYDPFVSGEASEAIQLQNVSHAVVSLAGWKLVTSSSSVRTVTFPIGATLLPGEKIWVSKSAAAFFDEFGFKPAYEYGGDSDPTVPDMSGSALVLGNSGGQVWLKDDADSTIDAMAYENGSLSPPDWSGPTVQPYTISGASTEGQILYRKMREEDGLPVPDTDTAADWAQDPSDPRLGKRVQYPGWDIDEFFQTLKGNENATFKYCVAPDHLYTCLREEIIAATQTISIEIYSIDHPSIVDDLTHALDRGVRVSMLLDAGALDDAGRWACYQLETHGGECWLMAGKPQSNIHKRYDNQHGKWIIIDHARVLIGSENLSDDAAPSDDKGDGTFGARGGVLIGDSPTLVHAAQTILDRDFDPVHHADIRRWGTFADDYPPLGYVPDYDNGGNTYPVQFPTPFTTSGTLNLELVQCPDNCLRASDALLGLVARADAGDTVYVEQLYERKYWSARTSNPVDDPNPRLEAYLAAARRGARVRILLDQFYDSFSDPRSNLETCRYVNQLRAYYDIECRLGNPTGLGIHLKMVLVKAEGSGFVHLGSINGSETSSKLNRELAVQLESLDAFGFWESVFAYDWSVSTLAPHQQFLPFLFRKYP